MTAVAESRSARILIGWGETMIERPVTTLIVFWLLQLVYLAALQSAGLPFGFAVWPMGEDRNWVRFMLDAPGVSMVREFWRMNDRNPLSPWWYWLFSKPILAFDWGLYAVRKLVDVFLAVAVTMLLRRLMRATESPLPLVVGLLVLLCTFNGYREQIVWNFLVASGLGLLSLLLYARAVDDPRRAAHWLASALLVFLIAIATYTLNLGLLVAIAAIALIRRRAADEASLPRAGIRSGMFELVLFTGVALVFLLIWYTTARPSSDYYRFDSTLVATQFFASVRQLAWHPDFTYYIVNAFRRADVVAVSLPVVALALAVTWTLSFARRAPPSPTWPQLGWIAIVFASVVSAIVVLESVSDVWLPGYRSKMVYQLSAPLLVSLPMGAAALVAHRLGVARVARFVFAAGASVAIICLVPAAMLYNAMLVENTAAQRALSTQLSAIADRRPEIRAFLIRSRGDTVPTWGSDAMSDTYARTILRRRNVTMRLLQTVPLPHPAWAPWWRVELLPDDQGVRNTTHVDPRPVPYSRVLFLDWDGSTLRVPEHVDRQWFAGLQVDWSRTQPVGQRTDAVATCPAVFDFSDAPLNGDGWSVPERQSSGAYSMWMAAKRATMTLATRCLGAVDVEVEIAGYMAEDIVTSLRLNMNGREVTLASSRRPDGKLILTGRGPALDATQGRARLEFIVPRTVVPNGGNRTLAVMFSRLEIRPSAAPATR